MTESGETALLNVGSRRKRSRSRHVTDRVRTQAKSKSRRVGQHKHENRKRCTERRGVQRGTPGEQDRCTVPFLVRMVCLCACNWKSISIMPTEKLRSVMRDSRTGACGATTVASRSANGAPVSVAAVFSSLLLDTDRVVLQTDDTASEDCDAIPIEFPDHDHTVSGLAEAAERDQDASGAVRCTRQGTRRLEQHCCFETVEVRMVSAEPRRTALQFGDRTNFKPAACSQE